MKNWLTSRTGKNIGKLNHCWEDDESEYININSLIKAVICMGVITVLSLLAWEWFH
jgi:hypothetical protein